MRKMFPLLVAATSISALLLVSAQAPSQEKNVAPKTISSAHQKGDIPIVEGHELHKFPIYLAERLTPGRHDLGTITVGRIGGVQVSVMADKEGNVTDIELNWPKSVKPERLWSSSHPVYIAGAGGLQAGGTAHCESQHAGGSCDGCSTYIWVEVTQFKPGVKVL